MTFNRERRQPRAPRLAFLAGSPRPPAEAEKPKRTRKKAAEKPPEATPDE